MKRKSKSKKLWDETQDLNLVLMVGRIGPTDWDKIASKLHERNGK